MFLPLRRLLGKHVTRRPVSGPRPVPVRRPAAFRSSTRLSLEALEDRILLTTDIFTNPLGGSWVTGSNWSLGAPPTATQDAVVSPTGIGAVVTHTSGLDTIHSLTSNGSLLISGGSGVTVTGDLSGTVRETTGGQLTLNSASSTLGDVTLDVTGGGVVNLSGTLDNTGHTLTVIGNGTASLTGTLKNGTISVAGSTPLTAQGPGVLDGV